MGGGNRFLTVNGGGNPNGGTSVLDVGERTPDDTMATEISRLKKNSCKHCRNIRVPFSLTSLYNR